jgi:hypothetical protein
MTILEYPGAVHVMSSRAGTLSYSPNGKEGFDIFILRKPVEADMLDGMIFGRTYVFDRRGDGVTVWRRFVTNLSALKTELKEAAHVMLLGTDCRVDPQASLWFKAFAEKHGGLAIDE